MVFFSRIPSVPLTPTKGEELIKQRQQLGPSTVKSPTRFGLPYLVPGTTPVGEAAGAWVLVLVLGCASSVWKEQQLQYNFNCMASPENPSTAITQGGSPDTHTAATI